MYPLFLNLYFSIFLINNYFFNFRRTTLELQIQKNNVDEIIVPGLLCEENSFQKDLNHFVLFIFM